MAPPEIVPFSDAHLEDAARLLAARHARQRELEPLLPERFEEPPNAREELDAVWHTEGASGASAFREGHLVGFVLGSSRDAEAWGENVWIEAAGHAVEVAEDIRDLYAAAAGPWFEEGRRRHYAVVPATDAELVEAWFRLGFGHQQALGLREVPARVEVRAPDRVDIREPREEDIDTLIEVGMALPTHQRGSPIFSARPLPTADEIRQDWRSTLAGGEETVLIGCLDGRPVACWAVSDSKLSSDHRGLARPASACFLAFASTLPVARGSGIGIALTNAVLAAAAEEGYAAMVTDWRVTNLLASRFWPRRGFRTSFVRLYRSIP
jgi:ribosomal protein S18 acetylase RimI-like enzyme